MNISNKLILGALIVATSLFPSCTIRQVENQIRSVTVTGTGTVEIENDQATITLSVVTKNWDVVKASQDNANRMTAVQEALVKAGIASDYITTSGYSIYQESSYQNGRNVPGQYNVTNQINVLVKDVTKAGSVIDTAIKAGANQLQSLTYSVSSTDAAVKQARLLAIKQAESIANTLATSSAATLGKVLTIVESQPNQYGAVSRNVYAKAVALEDAATPASGGKSSVSISVTATYEIQ